MPYPTLEEKLSVRMASHWLLPLLLLLGTLWFFFGVIPPYWAQRFSITFAIVGGILCLIFCLWFTLLAVPKLFESIPIIMGLGNVSTLFLFGYFFIVQTVGFRSEQLREFGLKTNAIVVDKTRIYSPKGGSVQTMDLEFTTADKQRVVATVDLGGNEYDRFQEGMTVPIYYSEENPDIARVNYRAFAALEQKQQMDKWEREILRLRRGSSVEREE